ncbi:hypothetical protein ACEWGH_00300 [Vibrio diabolicus]|uniref:hypothetical protein n=1 Tax=Vibrio diabolicus TaxID=50719 RepID=UPI0035A965E9
MYIYQKEDTVIATFHDYEKARLFVKAVKGHLAPSGNFDELKYAWFKDQPSVKFSLSNQPNMELIQQFLDAIRKLNAIELEARNIGYGNDKNDKYGRNWEYQQACAEREAEYREKTAAEVNSIREQAIILFHKIVFSSLF